MKRVVLKAERCLNKMQYLKEGSGDLSRRILMYVSG